MLCRIKSSRISASESSADAAMPQQSVRRKIESLSAARAMRSTMRLSGSSIFDAIPIPLAGSVLNSVYVRIGDGVHIVGRRGSVFDLFLYLSLASMETN
jgi:hypothetical protein